MGWIFNLGVQKRLAQEIWRDVDKGILSAEWNFGEVGVDKNVLREETWVKIRLKLTSVFKSVHYDWCIEKKMRN